jgi:hypothetical protein
MKLTMQQAQDPAQNKKWHRFKLGIYLADDWKITLTLVQFQKLEGALTQVTPGDLQHHYIFWEFDGHPIEAVIHSLREIQRAWDLSDIYITNDGREKSFGAWCFTVLDLQDYIHLLLETKGIDYEWIWWTHRRKAGCLRYSRKTGRPAAPQVIAMIPSYSVEIPKKQDWILNHYEAGVEKPDQVIERKFRLRGLRE